MQSSRRLANISGRWRSYSTPLSSRRQWLSSPAMQIMSILPQHQEYYRSLIKKFMFLVHPDYFLNFKVMKEVNSQNLRFLQNLTENAGQSVSVPAEMRTLIFYIKPSEFMTEPRKVKVSLQRLDESIVDILDALGLQPPVRPRDLLTYTTTHTASNTSSSSSTGRVWATYSPGDIPRSYMENERISSNTLYLMRFLESLAERKDLILWKVERMNFLAQVKAQLLSLTGLKDIAFHNSWSSLNNILLMQRLISDLTEEENGLLVNYLADGKIKKMLEGMTLVVHNDPMQESSVDYVEHKVFLDCSANEVSVEWVHLIISLSRLQGSDQTILSRDKVFRYTNEIEGVIGEALSLSVGQELHVKMRKGFTCSQRGYLTFLAQAERSVQALSRAVALTDGASDSNDVEGRKLPNSPKGIFLEVVIEENHGTKMLSDGNYRLDAYCDFQKALEMMQRCAEDCINCRKSFQAQKEKLSFLQLEIGTRLGVKSITAGLGIKDEMFLQALTTIYDYLATRKHHTNRGVLKHLEGLDLRIGHYTSIADDGACIIPWDCSIVDL
eukprot:scaffold967_cov173-Ochromonas_danica.AAC.40